jgi:Carboxypeptidase regulatory-like domain
MHRVQSPLWSSSAVTKIIRVTLCLIGCVVVATPAPAQQIASIDSPRNKSATSIAAPGPQPGNISGTVLDTNNDIVPGATVVLDATASGQHRTAVANDDGAFEFGGVDPGSSYQVTISADGFVSWTSPSLTVNPGHFVFLTGRLAIAGGASSVTVYASSQQIAVEQVRLEEKQRVLGIFPNFYVTYDHDAAPLTAKLKFKLALRTSTDPVVFLGAAAMAGINQAGDRLDYVQGAKGYGQRFGAEYTDSFVNIMIGGAILPSLLHQDPRYFYQGSGTTKSRVLHAVSYPFICKGDNGRLQPNYSSIGGDLATGAISNIYYPSSNRGPGLVFEGALISTGGRMLNGLIQEFILRRFTPSARHRN